MEKEDIKEILGHFSDGKITIGMAEYEITKHLQQETPKESELVVQYEKDAKLRKELIEKDDKGLMDYLNKPKESNSVEGLFDKALNNLNDLVRNMQKMRMETSGIEEVQSQLTEYANQSLPTDEDMFTNNHYEVVQKWFSEIATKKTDKNLKDWLGY